MANIEDIKTIANAMVYVPREDVKVSLSDREQEEIRKEIIDKLTSLVDKKTEEVIIMSAKEKKSEQPSFFEIMDSIAPKPVEKSPGEQIRDIKKRLKHCKNFMERKSLEKELESLYKLKRGKTK